VLNPLRRLVEAAHERRGRIRRLREPGGRVGAARQRHQAGFEGAQPGGQPARFAGRADKAFDGFEKPSCAAGLLGAGISHAQIGNQRPVDTAGDAVDADTATCRAAPRRQRKLARPIAFGRRVGQVGRHQLGRTRGRGQAREGVGKGAGDAHRSSLRSPGDDQRLMLVVSCNISSTVWMTLALDE
jgi:hypothetical protein